MKPNKITLLFLISLSIGFIFAGSSPSAKADTTVGPIYIPPFPLPVQQTGNVYTFTQDVVVNSDIIVRSSNIIIDGNGHTVRNARFVLAGVNNVTVSNFYIKNNASGATGIYLNDSSSISLVNNTITGTIDTSGGATGIGGAGIIIISGTSNVLVGNTLAENQVGLTLSGVPGPNALIYHNNFGNNNFDVAFNGIRSNETEGVSFNKGTLGNYWSGYNGTDSNGDGVGDTPYTVNAVVGNVTDLYPLMMPFGTPIVVVPDFPNMLLVALFLPAVIAALVFFRKKLGAAGKNVRAA
jgi:hypothetical protein